jgi:predicted ATPase
MLKALQLENFKSWREVNAPLAPITGFFGTNSSGKSSLLQALLLMKQSAENSDIKQVLEFGSEKSLIQLNSFQEIIWQSDTSKLLLLGLAWKPKYPIKKTSPFHKGLLEIKEIHFQSSIKSVKDTILVHSFQYTYDNMVFAIQKKDSEIMFEKFYSVFDTQNPISKNDYLADLQTSFETALSDISYLGPLRDYPKRFYSWSGAAPSNVGKQGENTISALLAARVGGNKVGNISLENYIAEKLKELGLIDSFRIVELGGGTNVFRVLVQRTPESPEVSLTDVGFGVSQVLPVLVLCYYVPEGSTILLEQPELHLHPSVQSGLADIFIDAYQKRGVQIILESHSEHLLRRLQRRIAEEKILPTDVNLYFCSLEKGESKLEALELDEYGNIHNYPKDFFGDRFEEMAAMTEKAIERRAKKALELK